MGGHSLAIMLKEKGEYMQWYNNELLQMAKQLGYKLLPAFNTTSGLPYPRVSISKYVWQSLYTSFAVLQIVCVCDQSHCFSMVLFFTRLEKMLQSYITILY